MSKAIYRVLITAAIFGTAPRSWSRPAPASGSAYDPAAEPNLVQVLREDWQDTKRDRKVPVKIYFPKQGTGPFPVIIFSHGLGGSRDGYEYLGHHWASAGYVSVHVQHLGSDTSVWKGAWPGNAMARMRSSATSLQNALDRPQDISFAIDRIEELSKGQGPLGGRVDLQRIGVAGHSFCAFTTLAVAGEMLGTSEHPVILKDPRVKAGIAMSAPVPLQRPRWDTAFGSIAIPVFHMTGTRDDSPIGDTKAADRRIPYDRINTADQLLVTFKDGDHMIFSGRAGFLGAGKDAAFQQLIKDGSRAFWDAYLKNDPQARTWLEQGGFANELGNRGTFEEKLRH